MKGIVLQQGSYIEMVIEEHGSTRLLSCFDFFPDNAKPIRSRPYRLEYWEAGQLKRQTIEDQASALALFYERIGGKPEDPSLQKRLFMRQMMDRIDRGLCIHCGTAKQVIRALCVECRTLPQFQEVLDGHMHARDDERAC